MSALKFRELEIERKGGAGTSDADLGGMDQMEGLEEAILVRKYGSIDYLGASMMASLKQGSGLEAVGYGIAGLIVSVIGGPLGPIYDVVMILMAASIWRHNAKIDRWIADKTVRGIRATTYYQIKGMTPSASVKLAPIYCPYDRRIKRRRACQGG